MATFNTATEQPDHADRAARTALAIVAAGRPIAATHPGWPIFRAGVNTGTAVVGNVGAVGRRSFAVIGDTTNTASRLMSLGDPGEVTVSRATWEALGPGRQGVALGESSVKGRRQPVDAWILSALGPEPRTRRRRRSSSRKVGCGRIGRTTARWRRPMIDIRPDVAARQARRRPPDLRGPAVPRPRRAPVRPGSRVRRRDAPQPPLDAQGDRPGRRSAPGCSPRAARAPPPRRRRRPLPRPAPAAGSTRRGRGRRLHGHPRGDRGPVPGRRLERAGRPDPERRRPQRHHDVVRDVDDEGRGRAADDPVRPARCREELRAAGQRRGLRLALRPRRQLLDVLAGRHERELPARRPGGRRRRDRDVHEHLPGLLPGPLAARPLRGLSEPRPGHGSGEPDRDLADRAARRTSASRSTRPTATGAARPRSRRSRSPATWSSATTRASTRSARCPARSTRASRWSCRSPSRPPDGVARARGCAGARASAGAGGAWVRRRRTRRAPLR